MPFLEITNREGAPLVAEIYKDSELVGTTNTSGKLELPTGDYVAKVNGYDEKRFRVRNQATPNYVVMATLSQVKSEPEGFFKKLNEQDKFVLIGISIIVVAFAAFYTIKKRRNAKG